ncbi:MAG: lipase family protein [Gordonibacter sp.]|nr:lipase family protein [Gordonibacter sp.]
MRAILVRRIIFVLATMMACFLVMGLFIIQARYVGVRMGMVPTTKVSTEDIKIPNLHADGSVIADYCSEAVTTSGFENLSGRTSTAVSLDDAWFSHDSHFYQHDLATTCAVLAAVCNSESQYYSNVKGSMPYAEQTLGALGFDDVRTESYALRSSLLDELGTLFTGAHDVAAYTFASKTISATASTPATTLVFVGIRGSYGVEWLSNFNLSDASGAADHQGFRAAEDEVQRSLTKYIGSIDADPDHTRILITGHSRGGAIANLLAARLDNLSGTSDQLAPASGIYAYTFAAPGATREADQHSATYENIFNIVNESDIVPQLPLSIWGYGRYGTTVTLPSVSSKGFDGLYEAMCDTFKRNTGVAPQVSEDDLASLDAFGERAARGLSSSEAFDSPLSIVSIVQALFGIDLGAALNSHYPDTYIAWMQSVPAGYLSFSAPAHAA